MNRMREKLLIALLVLGFINFNVNAQKNITYQNLYWLRYYNQLSFGKKLTWHNEFENRRFNENIQHHFIIHSRIHYKVLNNLDVGVGVTYSLQSPQIPNSVSTLIVPEIRPEQELNFKTDLSKKISLLQRVRVDERFFRKNNGKVLQDGYDFNMRFRYRLQLNYVLSNEEAKVATTFKLADEIMFNTGEKIVYNVFDQNRIYIGLEQGINKNFTIELGYMYWFQQRAQENQFFDRDIVRLTLLHKIKLK